jgi:hypothetical protein
LSVFIITVVLIATVAVLAYPFFARPSRHRALDDAAEELAQRLRRSRDRVYEEIRALQQEYFLNNLSEEEYRTQLQAARLHAADLMRQQQQVQEALLSIEEAVDEEMRQALEDPAPAESKERSR